MFRHRPKNYEFGKVCRTNFMGYNIHLGTYMFILNVPKLMFVFCKIWNFLESPINFAKGTVSACLVRILEFTINSALPRQQTRWDLVYVILLLSRRNRLILSYTQTHSFHIDAGTSNCVISQVIQFFLLSYVEQKEFFEKYQDFGAAFYSKQYIMITQLPVNLKYSENNQWKSSVPSGSSLRLPVFIVTLEWNVSRFKQLFSWIRLSAVSRTVCNVKWFLKEISLHLRT